MHTNKEHNAYIHTYIVHNTCIHSTNMPKHTYIHIYTYSVFMYNGLKRVERL